MTTPSDLSDLRGALEDRASTLDAESAARVGAIHTRVTGVRRRRRAVAAIGVAAVLATVAGVSLVPGEGPGPEPATTIVGVQPPATLTSLGFTYELDGTAEGSGVTGIRLPAADAPRLVSWATSGDDPRVQIIEAEGAGAVTYTDADFTNWVLLPAGEPATVRARAATGDVGLAYYSLGEDRPAGVTEDGVTFRQEIARGQLIGAAIGEPGQSEVTVSGPSTGQGLGVAYFCSGGPRDAYLHVGTPGDGESISGGSCADAVPVDPGGAIRVSFPADPGGRTEQRLFVTRGGPDGPRVEAPGLRIGLGLYALDTYGGPPGFVPRTLEDGGHRWRRVDLQTARADQPLRTTAPDDGSAVLAVGYVGDGNRRAIIDLGGDDGSSVSSNFGGSTQRILSPGDEVSIRVGSDARPDAERGVAFYVRAD